MTKVTELSIRAKAAVQYPGWRVDFVGPATIALTHVMGRERVIEVRHRRRRRDGPIMRAAKWIVPAEMIEKKDGQEADSVGLHKGIWVPRL